MRNSNDKQRAKFISALEKVFREKEPVHIYSENKICQGERMSFQFCFQATKTDMVYMEAESDVLEQIEFRRPRFIPAFVTKYGAGMDYTDDYVIFKDNASTYYPDKLEPMPSFFWVMEGEWNSIWITVDADIPAGDYSMKLAIFDQSTHEIMAEGEYGFSVLPACLETCDIPITRWIYYDCIEDAHNLRAFEDEYFEMLEKYFENSVEHGFNTALLPLFSHPQKNELTARPKITQIVGIEKNGDEYRFDFSLLRKFILLAKKCGIQFFETSHIASQQGAKHCPTIWATVDGVEKVIFDIHTPCASAEYIDFLEKFFGKLAPLLEELGVLENCYFHISDEPFPICFDEYMQMANILRGILPKGKLIDALHNREFAETKVLDYPVVSTQCVEHFKDYDGPIWVYYCCEEGYKNLSNDFFNHPLLRTRVIGVQLYLNDAKGFLHWAMNYWYDIYSLEYVNPDYVADGNGVFPAGDSFMVYPGADGPLASLREEAFADGIRDYRMLKTLEKKKGKDFVLSLLEENGFFGYTGYTHDETQFTLFMEQVQQLLLD